MHSLPDDVHVAVPGVENVTYVSDDALVSALLDDAHEAALVYAENMTNVDVNIILSYLETKFSFYPVQLNYLMLKMARPCLVKLG